MSACDHQTRGVAVLRGDPDGVEHRSNGVRQTFYDTALYLDFPQSTRRAFSRVFLSLVFISGCRHGPPPSEADRDAGATAPPARGVSRTALASELCEILHTIPAERKAACCGAALEGGLVEACRAELVAARGADIDEARLARCRSAMEAASRGCDWVTPFQRSLPPECQSLLTGTRKNGEPCRSSLECQSQLHCDATSGTRAGKCRPPADGGEACGTEVDPLATFVRQGSTESEHPTCKGQCSFVEHRCGDVPSVGAKCYSSANCAPSHSCIQGRCEKTAAANEGESCGRNPCAAGLRCVRELCLPLARVAESCDRDADCRTGGCVGDATGARVCGMKCQSSLTVLRSSTVPTFELPLRRRDANRR